MNWDAIAADASRRCSCGHRAAQHPGEGGCLSLAGCSCDGFVLMVHGTNVIPDGCQCGADDYQADCPLHARRLVESLAEDERQMSALLARADAADAAQQEVARLTVERLAAALHKEELCWDGVDECQGPAWHGEASRIIAALASASPVAETSPKPYYSTAQGRSVAHAAACRVGWCVDGCEVLRLSSDEFLTPVAKAVERCAYLDPQGIPCWFLERDHFLLPSHPFTPAQPEAAS